MQTLVVKAIVKLYFIGALALSFTHIMEAAGKLHTTGWQIWCWPFMMDGIAVVGMVMRSKKWCDRTNKIGFRVQGIAGMLSLTANIFAGNTVGDRLTGIGAVVLFIFSEWLSDQLVTREVAEAERETAELEAIAALPTAEEILREKRREAGRKAAATRAKNKAKRAREAKAQAKALEALVAA